jgi:hypothetical protein
MGTLPCLWGSGPPKPYKKQQIPYKNITYQEKTIKTVENIRNNKTN